MNDQDSLLGSEGPHRADGPALVRGELTGAERNRRWRELITLYLIMTLGTFLLDQLANMWGVFSSASVLLVALGFIFLPTEWLLRRGESPLSFGIGGRADLEPLHNEDLLKRSWRSSRQALKISLIVFPLFIIGTHLWRTYSGHEAHVERRAFTRWDEAVRGINTQRLKSGEVSISARADHITLKWRLKAGEREIKSKVELERGALVLVAKTRGVRLKKESAASPIWLISGDRSGSITIKTIAERLSVESFVDDQLLASARYRLGEYNEGIDEASKLIIERDYSWLWSIFLMQLFLVGLPEEIFYRGYLQTRLDSLVGQDQRVFGVHYNWKSSILCSALFAIAHLVTIPHPSRLAVFFPSLLFGWMRRAYHDTLSPAIFHALCNVLSQLLWGVYALSA